MKDRTTGYLYESCGWLIIFRGEDALLWVLDK